MAHFKNAFLGEVNGRIGNFVIRKMNGKDFISLRPRHYKKSQSQPSKMIRSNFAQISKLASYINSEPFLSKTWRQSAGNSKSVYHTILKTNLQRTGKEMFNTEFAIVPPCDLELISAHQVVDGVLEITFKNSSQLPYEANDINSTLHIIIVLYPLKAFQNKQQLFYNFTIPFKKEIIPNNSVSVNLSSKVNMVALQKNISLLNVAVIWNNPNTSELNWSLTYSSKLF